MNKMMVAVFDDEALAFKGLSALKDLHRDGDLTLYATAVVVKDRSGKVHVQQAVDDGPVGAALGLLAGSLVGILAGPVGVAVGASIGGITGLIQDLNTAGIDIQFVEEVATALSPGKAAVLADVEETWTTPADARIKELSGIVFRRLRSEIVEDQLAREAAALRAELKQLQDELAQGHAENKAEIQMEIEATKRKARAIQEQARARLDRSEREAEAKVLALQAQLKQAGARRKARIETRIAETRADLAARAAKLQEAGKLAKEAVKV